jgi:hypothetical protein
VDICKVQGFARGCVLVLRGAAASDMGEVSQSLVEDEAERLLLWRIGWRGVTCLSRSGVSQREASQQPLSANLIGKGGCRVVER